MRRVIQLIPYDISKVKNGGTLRSTNILMSFKNYSLFRVTCDGQNISVNQSKVYISRLRIIFERILMKLKGEENCNIVDIYSLVWLKNFQLFKTDIVIIENLCYTMSSRYIMSKDLSLVYNSHNFDVSYAKINSVDISLEKQGLIDLCNYKKTQIICCSERERKQYLEYISSDRITVIPNGTHRIVNIEQSRDRVGDLDFYFIGDLRTHANREAVDFLTQFWGQNNINKNLFIVGRSESFTTSIPNVFYLGELSDAELETFFLFRKVLIVPIFKGEGTRLKILEAMERGNIVVTTAKGIEGLDFDETHYLLFANSADLNNIINNLHSYTERLDLVSARLQLESYYWDVISSKFEQFLTYKLIQES
jgi:glycosyltransferase involved in cell wall biosynthesis